MTTYQPYTYYLIWTSTDMRYYGVEYGKNANPSNLWKTYFTSSIYVDKHVSDYGPPDIIGVHCIFDNAQDAVSFETRILRWINAANSSKFLNRSNGGKHFTGCATKGKTYDEIYGHETATKLKLVRSISMQGNTHSKGKKCPAKARNKEQHGLWNIGHTSESKTKMSIAKQGLNNPCYDSTSHQFYHNDYGVFVGTRYELRTLFPDQNINSQCLLKVIQGKTLCHKGWKILCTTNNSTS